MGDGDSIETIVRALYEVVSGSAGERDWERERAVMHPGARLMRTRTDADGHVSMLVMSPAEYEENVTAFLNENDFWEIEIHRKIDRFGNVAQVFSTYEARRAPDDPELIKRGINSIQLYHDGSR